jgi:hypothetical protein
LAAGGVRESRPGTAEAAHHSFEIAVDQLCELAALIDQVQGGDVLVDGGEVR